MWLRSVREKAEALPVVSFTEEVVTDAMAVWYIFKDSLIS